MSNIKPKVLEWCIESWRGLRERKDLIIKGWKLCCTNLYDVKDPDMRIAALSMVVEKKLEEYYIPEEEELGEYPESDEWNSDSEEEEEDERDMSIPIPAGKKSGRKTTQPERLSPSMNNSVGLLINSSHLAMECSGEEPDSDANGMEQ